MNSIIICKSIHLGNIRKIADITAHRLGCEVLEPESFDIYNFAKDDCERAKVFADKLRGEI